MDEVLLWCDVETTGIDPKECKLLQVAAIMTDVDGNELAAPFERIVQHFNVTELKSSSDPYVQDMHDKTGLWGKLSNGTPLNIVDQEFRNYIKTLAPEYRQARLAGNSIRLDLNFIEEYLPLSFDLLHYRSVDVSTLSYIFETQKVVSEDGFTKKKTHDAMSDIRESLEEYRWILGHMNK